MQINLFAQTIMPSISQEYKIALTETDRLNLCIKAINAKLIYQGCSIRDIDQIFGTQYSSHLPTKETLTTTGVIDFSIAQKSPSDTIASYHSGWYLVVEFDFKGNVLNYYISNIHK